MAKPEWGAKRQCPNCGERFYDLNVDPATCPECGSKFEIDSLYRAKRGRTIEPAAAVETEAEDEELVEDDVEDAAVLPDEDEDDDDAAPAATAKGTGAEDEDAEGDGDVDDALLVDDEDDDEDLGDFSGDAEEDDDRR